MLCLIIAGGISFAAHGQSPSPHVPRTLPPGDPLELLTDQAQLASTPASRDAALRLLAKARHNFGLRSAGHSYDLKVRFTVGSLGQTNYEGAWEMEDMFVPGLGLRWIAKAEAGYTLTVISTSAGIYGEGTASAIPLRLHEARGLLFDPLPSSDYANKEMIRTATTSFHGTTLTCVLLSRSKSAANSAVGRAWEESEECIDPQTGLLQLHSEAPGRYVVYDYSNAFQLGSHILPRIVTVTEGGRLVSTISVESLEQLPAADPSLFVSTEAMKAGGAIAIASTTKMSRIHGQLPVTYTTIVRPVCVFGVVTPTGQLVEAHSLQPSDPNSQAAVDDAKAIDFSPTMPSGRPPRQRFVFVIEKFVISQ